MSTMYIYLIYAMIFLIFAIMFAIIAISERSIISFVFALLYMFLAGLYGYFSYCEYDYDGGMGMMLEKLDNKLDFKYNDKGLVTCSLSEFKSEKITIKSSEGNSTTKSVLITDGEAKFDVCLLSNSLPDEYIYVSYYVDEVTIMKFTRNSTSSVSNSIKYRDVKHTVFDSDQMELRVMKSDHYIVLKLSGKFEDVDIMSAKSFEFKSDEVAKIPVESDKVKVQSEAKEVEKVDSDLENNAMEMQPIKVEA